MAALSQSGWLLYAEASTRSSTTLHENIDIQEVKSPTNRSGVDGLRRWCYSLHALLCILHLVLLAMLRHHPEHRFTIPLDNSVLSSGLSAFLQAFYTLYTALLVFMTQRLALSASLSRTQTLTTTHDISEAWGGLGVAFLTWWRQIKGATLTSATILVFLYLTCISVLHVASPTIMQFQPFNTSQGTIVTSNSTWPDPSVNLSSLDWGRVTPIAPLMFTFGSSLLSTSGLTNSTLYDTVSRNQEIVTASVNTSTIRANCGLLPVLSNTGGFEFVTINASLSTLGNITVPMGVLWKDEILFLHTAQYQCATETCLDYPLLFAASTAIELSSSIQTQVSVDTTWEFTPIGGEAQNSSTSVYPIACSLYVLHPESTLDVQQDILWSPLDYSDEVSQEWSLWSPQVTTSNGTDSKALNTGILSALLAADFPTELGAPGQLLFCQQNGCPAISTIDVYLMSLLGVNASANSILAASESSAQPSVTLTPAQMGAAISQIAAELIWLAGQLGGFALTTSTNDATVFVARWRLNINQASVISALTASFILLAITYFVIADLPQDQKNMSVNGISVLEILWTGAHIQKLQDRFYRREIPSTKELRAMGLFDICLAADANLKGSNSEEFKTLRKLKSRDNIQVEQKPQADSEVIRVIPTRYVWCYLLHGILVVIHLALIAIFVNHTEHRIIIPLDSTGITITCKAVLQLFYVLYTTILVFMTQQLATRRALASRHSLTGVHDISRAWTGFAPAVVSLSQQRKGPVSFWMILWTTVYFACISILHISSSAIMEFQAFNSTTANMVQSTLAWPDPSVSLRDLNWTNIFPLVTVVEKLPDLSTEGLFSNIVYDTPSTTTKSLNATVNATTVDAHCGLLSNLSLTSHNVDNFTFDDITVNSSPLGTLETGTQVMWNNSVIFLNPTAFFYPHRGSQDSQCSECDNYLFFFVTTALDLDATPFALGSSVSVGVNWTGLIDGWPSDSLLPTYLVGCSLNATTTLDTLDLQNDLQVLSGLHPKDSDTSTRSQQWTPWSPANGSEFSNGILTAMSDAPRTNCPVSNDSDLNVQVCVSLTSLDTYIMESLGINITESALTTGSSAAPSVTLGQQQFEKAVSEIAAQLIWLAGHLDIVGFQPGNGTSTVVDEVVQLRLNINIIPLASALGASVVIFLLLFYLVGVTETRSLAVSSLGLLETLWLESHSQRIHERMLEVDDPSLENLRRAGMFEVCIADELAATKQSHEREVLLEDD